MVRANIRGVFCTYKTLKSGERRTYWYHRDTRTPLRGQPGSSEFMADLLVANQKAPQRPERTVNWLIRDYSRSIEFEILAETTKSEYRRMLTAVEREFGNMPIQALNSSRVRLDFLNWRDRVARSSGPREADHRLSAISSMLTWARDRGHIQFNHVKGFRRLYRVDRSEMIWLQGHIDAFMEVAPIEMQRALIIGLHTGLRQGDILALPWSAFDGTHITLRIRKNRRGGKQAAPTTIRCTETLRKMLTEMRPESPLIMTTKTDKAFQKRWFAKQWEITSKAAGIEELHFNDLRGTAITLLSEAGNTPQMIATVTRHSIRYVHNIMEKYLSRTKHLSDTAIRNFENSERTEFANRLQTVQRATNEKNKKSQQ